MIPQKQVWEIGAVVRVGSVRLQVSPCAATDLFAAINNLLALCLQNLDGIDPETMATIDSARAAIAKTVAQ